jgi:S-adenosylmethionine hydrolase
MISRTLVTSATPGHQSRPARGCRIADSNSRRRNVRSIGRADGKPAKEKIATTYGRRGNTVTFTLPAGRYLGEVTVGKGRARAEFEVKAGDEIAVDVTIDQP